jgi:hypothetical protein
VEKALKAQGEWRGDGARPAYATPAPATPAPAMATQVSTRGGGA